MIFFKKLNFSKKDIGETAEDIAVKYLISQGHKILYRNFRTSLWRKEIDIISYDKKDDCLVFSEVKYRCSTNYGLPQEYVTKRKQQNIIQTAKLFMKLKNNKKYNNYRFDVISVLPDGKIEHIKNSFLAK